MDAAELRRWCLAHTGAVEEFPFGPRTSAFKVAGKMFALSALDGSPLEVSVKCEPELAVELRGTYAAIRPGYHLNKRHWNTVTLDGSLPAELIRDLVEDSYDLVVSARSRSARARSSGGRLRHASGPAERLVSLGSLPRLVVCDSPRRRASSPAFVSMREPTAPSARHRGVLRAARLEPA